MKEDFRRTATPDEIARDGELVEQGMSEGAIGLSSGLEYDVASYSDTDELVALAAAAAKHGGFYMTHIRDEADKSFEAFEEAIAIGERAHIPVQISHIKLGTVGVWDQAPEYIRVFEAARARGVDYHADCYPYDAWHSNLKVLVPNKQYEDPPSVEQALADVGGASRMHDHRVRAEPGYEKHTLEQLAQDGRNHAGRHVHSPDSRGRCGRRRGRHHRPVDDRGRHRGVLSAAVGHGRERRRHRHAIIRAAPARSRACSASSCARSTG